MAISDRLGDNQINIRAYGVGVGIRAGQTFDLSRIAGQLEKILPCGFDYIRENEIEHLLEINLERDGEFRISREKEILASGRGADNLFDLIESQIRLTFAEFAKERLFLHAGVVAWRGRGLIIPASSFAGKTTLVAELIKRGALYYSDEYAVLDRAGLVYPYPKMLSLRGVIDEYKQFDVSAKSLGARTGREPIPVGLVLISHFDKNKASAAEFKPEILSAGQGIIEMLAHSISIRNNPNFALEVLNKISTRAIIAKSRRGEAEFFVSHLLKYLNNNFVE